MPFAGITLSFVWTYALDEQVNETMATASTTPQIDPKLLDILRCPVAVHYKDRGDDPGRLELVRDNYWLYSPESGYKYPVIDGIPKMLIEEGAKWKDTEVDELPVPPPNEPIYAAAEDALPPEMQEIANKLDMTAQNSRTEAVQQLNTAAREIRAEAGQADSDALKTRAEEIAAGLETAASYLERGQVSAPASSEESGTPWVAMTIMFVLGLFVGIILRSASD